MKRTYDIFEGNELVVAELIQQRRLQMLVHSCLYYELDTNLISDKQWSDWAKELAQLQSDYPEISKEVRWATEFADWDGTTGAFLSLRDDWVMQKAHKLMILVKAGSSQKKVNSEPQKQREPVKTKSKVKRLF